MSMFQSYFIARDKILRSTVLALRSLWLHMLRSFLSVLGITIGTLSVISLMAFGEGSMQDALEDIKRAGATNIIVKSVKPTEDTAAGKRAWVVKYGLTYEDYEAFLMVDSVADSVPMRYFPQEIRRLHRAYQGRVVGVTQSYERVNRFKVAQGRFIIDTDDVEAEADDNIMRNVCVLGSDVALGLFPFESALGKTIVLNKHQYVVVGVLADRTPGPASAGNASAEDFNSDVFIPLRTCRSRFGDKLYLRSAGSRSGEEVALHQITLTISDMNKVRSAGAAIQEILERKHFKKDWSITVPLDRLEEAERARDRYKVLLFFIASISLLVGGIGIMNIMLATVTERTREIGIRRALGAKRRDITAQFLIEAMVQTSVGGLLGVILGLAVVFGVPWLSLELFGLNMPAKLHVQSIFWSLGVAIGVGVAFGWYPAQRAANLDPIEALRHM